MQASGATVENKHPRSIIITVCLGLDDFLPESPSGWQSDNLFYPTNLPQSDYMNLKSLALTLAGKTGQLNLALNAYETLTGDVPWAQDVYLDDDIRQFKFDESNRKGYVLFPLIPGYRSLTLRFCTLGHAFRAHGYEPLILRDDRDLPARPELTVDESTPTVSVEACRYRSKRLPELFNIKTIDISDVTHGRVNQSSFEDLNSVVHKEIPVSDCAAASMRKYLKKYRLDLDDIETQTTFEKFLIAGIMIVDAVEKLLEQYNITLTIINEPNYIQGAVPARVCKKYGVDVYTQCKGYHEGQLIFGNTSNRDSMPQFGDDELTAQAVNIELSEDQQEEIDNLMQERKGGEVTRVFHTTNTDLSVNTADRPLVGIFSHLLWDAALEPDRALYDDIYDWLDETIQIAEQKQDVKFVIKSHPAENIHGANERTGDWLRETHEPLPENIDFLPPDTDVNTYALIENLDAGIVYASTVGLEMSYEGVPVVTGGYPPYHGFEISHDPKNKSAYRDLIQEIETIKNDTKRKERARRYLYFLFICRHLDFPPLAQDEVQLRHENIVETGSVYSIIVEQMLGGNPVMQPECMNLD